jgi:hypothetical protein
MDPDTAEEQPQNRLGVVAEAPVARPRIAAGHSRGEQGLEAEREGGMHRVERRQPAMT